MRVAKILAVLCCCVLCGCSVPEQADFDSPGDKTLSTAYRKTELKESTSADVLAIISEPDEEIQEEPECGLVSQTKNIIALQGTNKKGYKLWFNMIAFDENELTAKRKSFFVVDEKTESLLIWPRRRLVFKTKMVLEPKVLNEPYANDDARQIAILKQVAENMRKDIAEVAVDNKRVGICGMLINQTLGTVLYRVERSPVLTSRMNDLDSGLEFDHLTLGKGKIVMCVYDDIVKVKVKLDNYVWSGEDPFALEE
ncbi:MAG: hypothetical protein JW947_05365 [Sedimentisphaerales bacterium]|nr:hypothetical protein [Sedimentisphaerales bacterium]